MAVVALMIPFTGELIDPFVNERQCDNGNNSQKYLSNASVPMGDSPEDSAGTTCQGIRDLLVGFVCF
jgi:hypothetical protein